MPIDKSYSISIPLTQLQARAAFYMARYGKETPTDTRAITDCLKAHDVGFKGLTPIGIEDAIGIENADPRITSLAAKINAIVTHDEFGQIGQGNPNVGNTEKPPEI